MQDPDLDQSVNDTAVEAHLGKKKKRYQILLLSIPADPLFSLFFIFRTHVHTCVHQGASDTVKNNNQQLAVPSNK